MSSPTTHVSTAPSTATNDGQANRGVVSLLPINAGDPVWVRQDGTDSDIECYMTDDYIAQVGDRVLFTKVGRSNVILGKIAPQPGWVLIAGWYGASIADYGTPYDPGGIIKLGTIVYLRGLIKTTAAVSAGATLINLNPGFGFNIFDTNGSMFHTGLYATGAGALVAIRLRLVQYSLKLEAPALPSGANIGLTGLSWPADI